MTVSALRMLAALLAAVLLAPAASGAAAAPCPAPLSAAPPASHEFWEAASSLAPSVVSVITIRKVRDSLDVMDGLDFFHGALVTAEEGQEQERTTSSGFVVDAAGYVVSSAHAVLGAREAWVVTQDKRWFEAEVVGMDRGADVTLLKIDAAGLPVARLSGVETVCAGQWVAALGNPFGFEQSVTIGAVSAYPRFLPGREAVPLIQSDVVLNPGSSGGPLFDASGAVVGLNSMVFSASGVYIGLSFSLPIAHVMRLVAAIRSGRPRGTVEVATQPVDVMLAQAFRLAAPRGVVVTQVRPGGAGEAAGLRAGDVILGLGNVAFATPFEFEQAIAALAPGTRVPLQVWREGRPLRVEATVGPAPFEHPSLERHASPVPVRLGLDLRRRTATPGAPAGLYVMTAGGPGLLAGIEPGDRVVAINGVPVESPADVDAALESLKRAPLIAVLVARGSTMSYVPVLNRVP